MMNFLKKIHFKTKMHQYLKKMQEFLKVMELNYSLSHQLTDSKGKTSRVEAGHLTYSLFFH